MANYCQNLQYAVNEALGSSEPRSLELKFSTGVASPMFTGKKIKGGGGESIGVILVDSQTHQEVVFGPIASATVKIVLLPEDFGGATTGDGGVWTPLEFKNSIVTNWKNKKNLLQGDCSLVLKQGTGIAGEIKIKHDRNYLSKVKFRLGAMVVDFSGKVKEAITDPFEIKDGRNELINKNRPLLLTDKVWQLKNIGKKGPVRKRLEKANVETVKDFLDMLASNPRALQKIYGSNGKKWEMTVRHAKIGVIDNVCDVYGSVGSTSQQSKNVSVFDCIDDCYVPCPYEDGQLFDDMMGMDLSIEDYEECGMVFQHENHGIEPCLAEDKTCGASTRVGGCGGVEGGMVHKRWIKLCRVWFSVRSFTKVGGVGAGAGATLLG